MNNCNVIANNASLLANKNYGSIKNCNINGVVTATFVNGGDNGFMVRYNYGTITNCVTSGKISAMSTDGSGWDVFAGGLVEWNSSTGKIISCISKVDVSAESYRSLNTNYAGGIAAENSGLINDCEANGTIASDNHAGGIAGENNGQIMSSYYTGASSVNIAAINNGVIS